MSRVRVRVGQSIGCGVRVDNVRCWEQDHSTVVISVRFLNAGLALYLLYRLINLMPSKFTDLQYRPQMLMVCHGQTTQ
jgi:hypothetical protein